MGMTPSCVARPVTSMLVACLVLVLQVSGAVGSTSKTTFTTEVPNAASSPSQTAGSISESEFRAIALELAPKVNLFRDVWAIDPTAKFTAGVVRDYLYWIRANATTPESIAVLRQQTSIHIRDILLENSDIDLISAVHMTSLDPGRYGFKRIEHVHPDRLKPGNSWYDSEIHQGFVPIEKLLLSQTEIGAAPGFGDGVKEIFEGKPTVSIPTDAEFAETLFAKLNANHLILLTLRYFRALSLNHVRTGASQYDIQAEILALPSPIQERIREVISEALASEVLIERFKNPKFGEWFYQGIEKVYRGGSPTFADALFKHFGLAPLIQRWADFAPPINQYLFEKARSKENLEQFNTRMQRDGVDPAQIFIAPETLGIDKGLFHGTKDDQSFSDILLRGVIQSIGGAMGAGLYVVTEDVIGVARLYAEAGGDEKRVVRFEGAPDMRIVSATSPELIALKTKFDANHGVDRLSRGDSFEQFCDYYGIDALIFDFDKTHKAIVIKNSRVLSRPVGVYRTVMTFDRALKFAPSVETTQGLRDFFLDLGYTSLTAEERWRILRELREPRFSKWVDLVRLEPNLSAQERGRLAELGLAMVTLLNGPPDLLERVMSPWQDPPAPKAAPGTPLILQPFPQIDVVKDRFYNSLATLMQDPKLLKVFGRLGDSFEWTTLSHFEAIRGLVLIDQTSNPLNMLVARKWRSNPHFRHIISTLFMMNSFGLYNSLAYFAAGNVTQLATMVGVTTGSTLASLGFMLHPGGTVKLWNDFKLSFEWMRARWHLKKSLEQVFLKALGDALETGQCNWELTPIKRLPVVEKFEPGEDAA